ncbi:MAG: rhomboid family intramembrane serine protease [Dehalococcoidia bacterium]|nr:rhomboid family intramembrane serine protease [Dehalococcoidia bacterium]
MDEPEYAGDTPGSPRPEPDEGLAGVSFLILLYRTRRPLVNFSLIAASTVVFLYEVVLGGLQGLGELGSTDRLNVFLLTYGLVPFDLTRAGDLRPVFDSSGALRDINPPFSVWTSVFTSMFIHGSLLHLVGNMLFLWGFGGRLEEKLGHVKYLLFYLAAGVAAVWTQVAVDMDSRAPLIGASGAIAGVVGAYLLTFRYPNTIWLVIVFFILPMIVGPIGAGVVSSDAQVAYMAHLGGLVAGGLMISGYKLLIGESLRPPAGPAAGSRPTRFWR